MAIRAKRVYVAATSQHIGKTTTTLGIVSAMLNAGHKVGYCKPVGQQFLEFNNLRVDKDAVLFADLIGFDLKPEIHSPVILGSGATVEYLKNPEKFDLRKNIMEASKALEAENDIVIYEGTGHPGVGSIADVSNAEVAKFLRASVIMVVEGGIGNTIDRLNLSLALFREENVPVIGVIINKIRVDKLNKVRKYVGKWLEKKRLPLLGCIPYDQTLAYPLMYAVCLAINGTVLYNPEKLNNRIEDIIAGSLIDLKELKKKKNLLLVVAARNIERAMDKLETMGKVYKLKESPLAGIVITGQDELSERTIQYLVGHKIPVVRTFLDTYGSVIKISKIEVKINRSTPWKINRAIELIEKNVDLDALMDNA